ncbi:MAG: prepilin-type N-terminal cleavage/methylation domain-containing protein [Phycisphaerae bacterium]|jgi:general secretion pathway protein G
MTLRRAQPRARAFSLIELLVVVAVIALLVAIVLPALGSSRETARGVACASNLRQVMAATRVYADQHRGLSPAIGVPYASLPNWALAVQASFGGGGETPGDLYAAGSILVCPTSRATFGRDMQRTYAINATGHAGLAGDPDHYDAVQAHIRLDRIAAPSLAVLFVDSLPAPAAPGSPPPTRTASMIDWRQESHVRERLARLHASRRGWNAAMADGSASTHVAVRPEWSDPLP